MNMNDDLSPTFADPMQFDVEAAKLARRRKIAQELIRAQSPGAYGAAGGVGAALLRGVGQYENTELDAADSTLSQRELGSNRALLQSNGLDPALANANPSIRGLVEKQMTLKQAQEERGAQLAADRQFKAEEAERNRIERGEQLAADRVAREDLRKMPSQSIHISTGGGGANSFGGAAPVIGADENQNPIYRHTKSGQLFQFNEQGQPAPYAGKVGAKPATDKPMNENQGNAMIYGTRAAQAQNVLDSIGVSYSPIKLDMARGAERIPGGRAAANTYVLNGNEQMVDQAQRNFINAVLRRESGAVISPDEFANARKQYFPEQGDSGAVLKQKKANRELVITGLGEVSGPQGNKAVQAERANKPKPADISDDDLIKKWSK